MMLFNDEFSKYLIKHLQLCKQCWRDHVLKTGWMPSSSSGEGRSNSLDDEESVAIVLAQNGLAKPYTPKKPPKSKKKPRGWFDIEGICTEPIDIMPINIKSSTFSGADNTGGFTAPAFALTGEIKRTKPAAKKQIYKWLQGDEFICRRDYGYFVVDKNNPSEPVINTLLYLNKINRNYSNQPYQIDWSLNTVPSYDPAIFLTQFAGHMLFYFRRRQKGSLFG